MPTSLTDPLYTTANSIPYWELPAYRETNEDENCACIRQWACLWHERTSFVADILGDAEVIGDSLVRYLPEADPEYPDFYAMSCNLVAGEGKPGRHLTNNALAFYDQANMTTSGSPDGFAVYEVTFKKPLYEVLEDSDIEFENERWTFRTREPSVENLPLPTRFLRFKDFPNEPLLQAGVVPFHKWVRCLTWYEVPYDAVPFDTIGELTGTINATEFEEQAPGTLLFLPPRQRVYQSKLGRTMVDITFMYEKRLPGYNYFLRAQSGTFERVVRDKLPSKGPLEEGEFIDAFDVSLP